MITTTLSFIGAASLLAIPVIAWNTYCGWVRYDTYSHVHVFDDYGVCAMVKLTGKRYRKVLLAFEEIAEQLYLWRTDERSFTKPEVFEIYAKNAGYKQMDWDEHCECTTMIDFARTHRRGKYVLIGLTQDSKKGITTNIVPCINGKLYYHSNPSEYALIKVYAHIGLLKK